MPKRYIRLDLEYDGTFPIGILSSIKQILEEDMPYIKVIRAMHSPNLDTLDSSFKNRTLK